MKTYPEMNKEICSILRLSENPAQLYAAARIEALEAENAALKKRVEWLKGIVIDWSTSRKYNIPCHPKYGGYCDPTKNTHPLAAGCNECDYKGNFKLMDMPKEKEA